MKLWGDMSALERAKAAHFLVRERHLTYSEAARQLVASRSAIAGALLRSDRTLKRSRAQKAGDTKSYWSEERLTEPWSTWSARRRAARLAARLQQA